MEPMETSPPPSSVQPEEAAPPPPPTTTTVPPPSSASPAIEVTPPPPSSSLLSSSSSSLNPNPSPAQNPNPSQNPNESIQTATPIKQPIPQITPQLSPSPFPQFSPFHHSSSASSSSASASSSSSTSTSSTSTSSTSTSSSLSLTSSSSSSLSVPTFSSSMSSSSSSVSSSFSMMSPSLPSSAPPSFSTASTQRGGLAIGVPAHQARPSPAQQQPSPPPPPFSSFGPSSFSQQFGGLGRSSVNVPESMANHSSVQVRPSIQSIGMIGSLSSGAQMRPSGLPLHHQQRMVQPSMRSQSPSSNQSLATQKFQNHGLLRGPSMTSPSSPSPGASQGLQSPTQPWMSSAPQLKQMPPPSLPSPSYRQPMRPQSLQQRPNHPQQHHHSLQIASHQQVTSAQPQQQQLQTVHSQDLYGQQYSQSRIPLSVPHQQVMRPSGPGNQKSSTPVSVTAQPSTVQLGGHNTVVSAEDEESGNHILTKRSIRELVSQIGPSEKFDPEVEDFLMLVAEDFVDSITTYGCSLAKHRKSATLEAKDILLHLERNWNMTVPGFGGEEIKSYKKPMTSDVHKERLVAIKKSMQGSDAVSTKSTGGQATGNAKGHSTKVPSSGSP